MSFPLRISKNKNEAIEPFALHPNAVPVRHLEVHSANIIRT